MSKINYDTDIRDFDFDFAIDIYEELYKENGEKYEYFPSKKELISEVCNFAREMYEDKFDVFFLDSYDDEHADDTMDYVTIHLVPNLYSDYMEHYLDSTRFEWGYEDRSYKVGFNIGGYVADKLGLPEFSNEPMWGEWECIVDRYLLEEDKENVGKSYEEMKPSIQAKLDEVKKCWQETEKKAIAELELIQSKEFMQSFIDHIADYINNVAVLAKD